MPIINIKFGISAVIELIISLIFLANAIYILFTTNTYDSVYISGAFFITSILQIYFTKKEKNKIFVIENLEVFFIIKM